MPPSNIDASNEPGHKDPVPQEDVGTCAHNPIDVGPNGDQQTPGSNVPSTTEGDPISPPANEPHSEQAPDNSDESPIGQQNGNEGTKEQNTAGNSSRSEHGAGAETSKDEKEKQLKWTELIIEADGDFESLIDKSPSQLEWLRQKRDGNEKNEYLDRIMSLVGHENVKAHFMAAKHKVDDGKRCSKNLDDFSFDLILHGNDGTGKRRIAQLYAEFLYSIGVVPNREFAIEDGWGTDKITTDSAVVFFAQADRIDRTSEMDDILSALKGPNASTVLILSYRELGPKSLQALTTSFESRRCFSNLLKLEDYGRKEILELLQQLCKSKPEFGDGSKALLDMLSHNIASRGLAKGKTFNNAHTIVDELDTVGKRWQQRKSDAWLSWAKTPFSSKDGGFGPEHFMECNINMQDILGSKPWTSRSDSSAWNELQKLVGLPDVKESIEHIIDLAEANHQNHLHGRKPLPVSLNRCFLGAPGVGKTTIAALYSKVLNELGLLSKGHIITKRASDLIGRHVGYSEAKVTEALQDAQGGVLVIDDAHLFYQETSNGENDSDSYRQGIIDTLVANVSGSPGEDRCVILCGYADKMERMFLKSNPGLARRFPFKTALRFASYSDDELHQILNQKMDTEGIVASEEAHKVARNMLSQMRRRPNFGNGGDVETLLSEAKLHQNRRFRRLNAEFANLDIQPLQPIDFDLEFDRASRADKNRDALFEDFVGFQHIKKKFQGYHTMAKGMRRCNQEPRTYLPWAFVFKGPPGTGKTSTARKVGKLFYDMDLLSSDEVVTCSVTNLIGEHVGHTGPKVINQFELGLGKVLFIDEAYRLIGDRFQKEAIEELVDAMTKPRYSRNMVVILAGYSDEMEALLSSNPGLRSRFPTIIDFPQMLPEDCLDLLSKMLYKLGINVPSSITSRCGEYNAAVLNMLEKLTMSKGWASGRDVETLSNAVIELLFTRAGESEDFWDSEELCLSFEDLVNCLKAMLRDRGVVLTRLWDEPGYVGFAKRQRQFGKVSLVSQA